MPFRRAAVRRLEPDRTRLAQMKKAARSARPFLFDGISQPGLSRGGREIRLAGGAQIVGRRLARATIGHDLVADLLAFTQRPKSGALYGADVNEHVVATVIRL